MPTMKTPTADAVQNLYDELEAARQAVVDACDDLVRTLDLDALTRAYADWEHAAELFNRGLEDLVTQVDEYIATHTDRWCYSPRGEAFAAWSVALQEAQIAIEPDDTLDVQVHLTSTGCELTVMNAADVLPETPEIPELDLP